MSQQSPLSPGSNAFPEHVFTILGEGLQVQEKRIGGAIMVAAGTVNDGPRTLMTAGASRLPTDDGNHVELAVEVAPDQDGAAVIAMQHVCNDIFTNRRTPPVESPWRNPEPFLTGTQINSIVATGSRWGAEFDEVREPDGSLVGHVRTLRLLTDAEAQFVTEHGWAALVEHAGSLDALLDVERESTVAG